jgi:quinol monooxygenase YgiN
MARFRSAAVVDISRLGFWTHTSGSGAVAVYGVIGKLRSVPGARIELIDTLTAPGTMPGCLRYIVSEDLEDEDGVWVTEIWESAEAHQASLELPEVQAAIAAGRALIAGFETRATTRPIGGIGFPTE